MKTSELQAEDLWESFDYAPLTGIFYRKGYREDRNGPAGCVRAQGYLKISFKNKSYLAHRLIWMWLHGTFDNECIDHINGITSDNRMINLRCVSLSDNQNNQSIHRNETQSICK